MSLGIELRTPSGQVFYSSDTITWNIIASSVVGAGAALTLSYPIMSLMTEFSIFRSFVNNIPDNQKAIAHTATVSGTSVSVSGGNVDMLITLLGR